MKLSSNCREEPITKDSITTNSTSWRSHSKFWIPSYILDTLERYFFINTSIENTLLEKVGEHLDNVWLLSFTKRKSSTMIDCNAFCPTSLV